MKKVSIFILVALLTMFVNTNSVSAAAVMYKPISDRVRAVNEDGEYLPGTFVLKTLDNRILANYIQVDCSKWDSTGIGCNEINTMPDNNMRLDKAIEDAILADFSEITTIKAAAEKLNVPCITKKASTEANQKYIVSKLASKIEIKTYSCDSHEVYKKIYYPMIVEQLTTAEGYTKAPKLIVLIKARITFSVVSKASSDPILKEVSLNHSMLDGYYTYDHTYDYTDMYGLSEEEIAQFKNEYYVGLFNDENKFHIVQNAIAMPHLEIDNYIDGDSTTTIKKGEQAKYKVVIKNTGNTDYTNNVITSTIPDELNYVTGSASNNGIYNANNRTVTWNIDLLSPESTRELTYRVEANSNITDTREIEMRSTIKNSENPTGTVTTPVLVKTSKNVTDIATSPKTGALLSIIMLISSLVIVIFLTIKYFKKQQNN